MEAKGLLFPESERRKGRKRWCQGKEDRKEEHMAPYPPKEGKGAPPSIFFSFLGRGGGVYQGQQIAGVEISDECL